METDEQQRVIAAAEKMVKAQLAAEGTGHDWYHIERVRHMASRLAQEEGADQFIAELAALLHNSADWKIVGVENENAAHDKLEEWLTNQSIPDDKVQHIVSIIRDQSFAASGVEHKKLPTPEGQVVQDADRLDALGAIGIARCFAYGGKRGRLLYDPHEKPRAHITADEYRTSKSTSVNHFYEKLFKLADLMNTKTGKAIAKKRHGFMEKYLEQFFAEWHGKV